MFFRASAPIGSDTTLPIYISLTATVVLFVLSFFALRQGSGGSETYWQSDGSRQVKRVALVIAIIIVTQLALGFGFDFFFDFTPAFSFTFEHLLAWTLVPAACLRLGVVSWPERIRKATPVKLVVAGLPAILFATAAGYNKYLNPNAEYGIMLDPMPLRIVDLLWAAAVEEVVFRVLLLTALLHLPVSRFQSVFLSGVAFAGMHAPLYLANPLFHADWPQLAYAATAYSPLFLGQTVFGLVLGLVWLRTGSFTLIAVTHAIINLGSAVSPNL
jgi:membrane protease YdiL (CAAX protease family)